MTSVALFQKNNVLQSMFAQYIWPQPVWEKRWWAEATIFPTEHFWLGSWSDSLNYRKLVETELAKYKLLFSFKSWVYKEQKFPKLKDPNLKER